MIFSEALQKYIAYGKFKNKATTMKGYENNLRHFALYMRNCELEEVKLDDVYAYLKGMEDLGWDPNSLSSKCGSYKQFFDFFKKQGFKVLDPSLIPIPSIEIKFPKIIGDEDYQKLLDATSEDTLKNVRNKLILRFLADTGARRNEVLSIDIPRIDTVKMNVIIKTEKSRGRSPVRTVFWTKQTNDLLIKYLDMRKVKELNCDALFIALHSKLNYDRMTPCSFHDVMMKLSKKANLGYVANPHRFRHRFGRKLAMQNANGYMIGDMMGHSDINSTRIYTMMNETMQQETYNKHFKT